MKKYLLFTTAMCMGWAFNSFSQCSVTLSTTNALCNGNCDGTMTATPFGGTLPYTYLDISDILTPLFQSKLTPMS
ncbi:MAG: SprB repeat-containing protein [Bacteroidetes bacterium]|nr:SprB repeat-containing protein [Bacteroidota bacterium]